MTEQEIIKRLLDGDPAIRWQVMCDLLGANEAAVIIVVRSLSSKCRFG